MPTRRDEGEEGGLSGRELVVSCYAALQAARQGAGYEAAPWDDLDGGVQLAFADTVGFAAARLGGGDDDNEDADGGAVSASALAREAAARFNMLCGGDEGYEPDVKAAVVFEALVRHVANALCFHPEDHGDVESHESGWKDWVAARTAGAS